MMTVEKLPQGFRLLLVDGNMIVATVSGVHDVTANDIYRSYQKNALSLEERLTTKANIYAVFNEDKTDVLHFDIVYNYFGYEDRSRAFNEDMLWQIVGSSLRFMRIGV
jgi:hypothetical protein